LLAIGAPDGWGARRRAIDGGLMAARCARRRAVRGAVRRRLQRGLRVVAESGAFFLFLELEGDLALQDLFDGDAKRVGRLDFGERRGAVLQLAGALGDGARQGVFATGHALFQVRDIIQRHERVFAPK